MRVSNAYWMSMYTAVIGGSYNGHLEVAKLVPQILDGVQANQRSDKETDQFNTSDTADTNSCHEQPEEPFRLEAPVLETVELGPAENRSNGTAEEHRVEQDEAADGGVRVLTEHHQRNEPHSRALQVELLGSPVGHGHADSTKDGIELAHKSVVDILGVLLARLELKRAVVSRQVA